MVWGLCAGKAVEERPGNIREDREEKKEKEKKKKKKNFNFCENNQFSFFFLLFSSSWFHVFDWVSGCFAPSTVKLRLSGSP